jgi:hypothetical protein
MRLGKRLASRPALLVALGIALLGTAPPARATPLSGVVISQIYGGGGNMGAPFKNDYIEVFNTSASDVSLAGWSLQYSSATGSFGQLTGLSGTISGGGYFLIKEATGAGGLHDLPSPDITGSLVMSAFSGKVALVNSSVSLGCGDASNPCGLPQLDLILDLVGYGSADFFEGNGAAPFGTNTLALIRAGSGCIDTDNNGADFSTGTPNPRNSSIPTISCRVLTDVPEPTTLALFCSGIAGLRFFSRRSGSKKTASRSAC